MTKCDMCGRVGEDGFYETDVIYVETSGDGEVDRVVGSITLCEDGRSCDERLKNLPPDSVYRSDYPHTRVVKQYLAHRQVEAQDG